MSTTNSERTASTTYLFLVMVVSHKEDAVVEAAHGRTIPGGRVVGETRVDGGHEQARYLRSHAVLRVQRKVADAVVDQPLEQRHVQLEVLPQSVVCR